MSFLKGIFGKSKPEPLDDNVVEGHLGYLNTLRKPAIMLAQSNGETFSRIGGLPTLPGSLTWPEWKGAPLAFLCQLDLSEIPAECARNGLPAAGMLYFFYDQEQEAWGLDAEDKGSWRVLYTAAPRAECAERAAPDGLGENCVYGEKPVAFKAIETYPAWHDDRIVSLHLTDRQAEQYIDVCASVFQDSPAHHLFGHPAPLLDLEMDLECQRNANGQRGGDGAGNSIARVDPSQAGKTGWTLLLQLDSDDDLGMLWGDLGTLYFWIKQTDLEAANFADCWMILQCLVE